MSDPLRGFADRFKERALEWFVKNPRRLYVDIEADDLLEVARYLWADLECRFAIATGTDHGDKLSILYHFSHDESGIMINIRVWLDRDNPEIESLTAVFVGAEWIEREMWELLGINFLHHPGLTHLLLVKNWPAGVYPLRQDFRKEMVDGLEGELDDE